MSFLRAIYCSCYISILAYPTPSFPIRYQTLSTYPGRPSTQVAPGASLPPRRPVLAPKRKPPKEERILQTRRRYHKKLLQTPAGITYPHPQNSAGNSSSQNSAGISNTRNKSLAGYERAEGCGMPDMKDPRKESLAGCDGPPERISDKICNSGRLWHA